MSRSSETSTAGLVANKFRRYCRTEGENLPRSPSRATPPVRSQTPNPRGSELLQDQHGDVVELRRRAGEPVDGIEDAGHQNAGGRADDVAQARFTEVPA